VIALLEPDLARGHRQAVDHPQDSLADISIAVRGAFAASPPKLPDRSLVPAVGNSNRRGLPCDRASLAKVQTFRAASTGRNGVQKKWGQMI
jgi:hypothetical protein